MRHRWFARPSLIPGPISLETPAPSQTSSRAPSPPPSPGGTINHTNPAAPQYQRPPRPNTRRSTAGGQNIISALFQSAPLNQPLGKSGVQKPAAAGRSAQKRWSRWLVPAASSSAGNGGASAAQRRQEIEMKAGNSKVFGSLLNQVRLFGNEVFGSGGSEGSPVESRRDSLATIEDGVASPRLSLRIQEKKVMEQIHADHTMTDDIQMSIGSMTLDSLPPASGKISKEEDKRQRDLIRGLIDGSLYLHPVCRMTYDFQYCMHRSWLGFTCLAVNNFTKDKVSVKFLYKQRIEASLWMQDPNGFRIPVEVMMYRANDNTQLPFFIQDFEDEQFFYIVTAVHGQPKKERKGLFESKFHTFDWDAHWNGGGGPAVESQQN